MQELPRNRVFVFSAVTLLGLTVDLWTKHATFAALGLFGRTGWLFDTSAVRFELHTNLNFGALWGMGQGFAPGFACLSVVAFAGIIYWLFVKKAAVSLWLTIALSLVSGGTLGNLYDRLGWHGVRLPNATEPALAVRDFLRFQFGTFDWPIFNVADMCLVSGAAMLMLQSLKEPDAITTGSVVGFPATEPDAGKAEVRQAQ